MFCFDLPSLTNFADAATVVTAIATASAWAYFICDRRRKLSRVEKYLLSEKSTSPAGGKGRRSVLNVMAYCGMTEGEVLSAAFRSKVIKTVPRTDWETGFASGILLEYETKT